MDSEMAAWILKFLQQICSTLHVLGGDGSDRLINFLFLDTFFVLLRKTFVRFVLLGQSARLHLFLCNTFDDYNVFVVHNVSLSTVSLVGNRKKGPYNHFIADHFDFLLFLVDFFLTFSLSSFFGRFCFPFSLYDVYIYISLSAFIGSFENPTYQW